MDARSLIENTLSTYAYCYDVGPLEPISDVWTTDAEVTFVDTGPFYGREAVTAEMVRRRHVPRYADGSRPWHILSNVTIHEIDEREAKVTTWWTFYIIDPDGKAAFSSIGYYDDVLRNDGDTWRIRHRVERAIGHP
jgi:hypothetical protein